MNPSDFAPLLRDAKETGILSLKDRGLKALPAFLKIEELSDLTEIGAWAGKEEGREEKTMAMACEFFPPVRKKRLSDFRREEERGNCVCARVCVCASLRFSD